MWTWFFVDSSTLSKKCNNKMVTPFEATQSLPDGVREGMGNFAGGGGIFYWMARIWGGRSDFDHWTFFKDKDILIQTVDDFINFKIFNQPLKQWEYKNLNISRTKRAF